MKPLTWAGPPQNCTLVKNGRVHEGWGPRLHSHAPLGGRCVGPLRGLGHGGQVSEPKLGVLRWRHGLVTEGGCCKSPALRFSGGLCSWEKHLWLSWVSCVQGSRSSCPPAPQAKANVAGALSPSEFFCHLALLLLSLETTSVSMDDPAAD